MTAYAIRMRSGKPGGGKGALVQEEVSGTLATSNDQTVICIQGTIAKGGRMGQNGDGYSDDGASYTLNTVDRHAVAFAQNTRDEVRLIGGDGSHAGATEADPEPTVTAFAIDRATTPKFSEELCHTLRRGGAGGCNDATAVILQYGDIAGTLTARYDSSPCPDRGQNIVGNRSVVRRLTPRECERLQGMPDGWTRVPYRGKPADKCPDGPRYKAIGNSMAVPVMRFIGERIQMVEESGVA